MFEAYKIGVTLSLTNHVSRGLMMMSKDFARTEAQATLLQKRIKSIQDQAIKGGIYAGLGFAGLALFDVPLKAAREYELAFTKFKTLNLGDVVNQQADKFARSANLMGISSKELMNTMSESVGLFGSYSEAQKLAPKIAVLNKANSSIFGGKLEGMDEGSTRSLMKFIDRRGGTKDEASFMRNLDLAQKMVTGSGGFVKFRDLDQFSQHGGTAFRGLSDNGILNMALLLQEQGGAKAGTSLMSIYQNLVAGRTPKKTMAMLQEFGLGTLAMQEHATVGGKSMKTMIMKDVKGAALLQSDPATWMRTVFLPALAAKGITDTPGILKATNDLLSNRNASNQASIMTTQLVQLLRDSNLAKNAMGYNQTINAYKKDPNSKFAELSARWKDTMVELGLVVLPVAIRGVTGLTDALKAAKTFIQQNHTLVKALALAFAGLAGGLLIRGSILLLTAAFRGLGLAMAFNAVGGVAGLTTLGASLVKFGKGLWSIATLVMTNPVVLGVLAAAGIGYGAGTLLNKGINKLMGPDKTLGTWLYDSTHPDPIAKKNQQPIQLHSNIHMDGRKVAESVTTHQMKSASRPQSGIGSFDPTQMAPTPALNYGF